MDPDETLSRLLELARKNAENDIDSMDAHELSMVAFDASEMSELILALDEWIEDKKGFLPSSWQSTRVETYEPKS